MKATVKRMLHRVIDSYLWSRAESIELQRQLLAAASTARFIERHAHAAHCTHTREGILRYAANLARGTPGLVCEFGVYQGGSINLLAQLLPERQIFGFDSFDGLPQDWRTGYQRGSFAIEGTLPCVKPNIALVKGWFSETLQDFMAAHPQPVSLAHIDCDIYSSARTVLEAIAGRIQPGTVLLFDEYFNYPGWQHHEHKAFREFARTCRLRYEYAAYNASHQQVVIRCTG